MTDDSEKTAGAAAEKIEAGKPFVLHLGKIRKKHIKRLERGEGRLMEEVRLALDQIRSRSSLDSTTELVPIVLIYRKKDRKKGWMFS